MDYQPAELMPHQKKALDIAYSYLLNLHKKTLIQMPSGAGKTAILVELAARLLNNHVFKSVLILASTLSVIEQLSSCFNQKDIRFSKNIRNSNSTPITLATYAALLRTYTSENQFDLIICAELQGSGNTLIQTYFDKSNACVIGFSDIRVTKTNWFNDVTPAFVYSMDDSIQDGFNLEYLNPHNYALALEGFCLRLFESLDYTDQRERESRDVYPDLILSKSGQVVCVEIKAYRNIHIPFYTLENAVKQMLMASLKRDKNEVPKSTYCLILFCSIDEEYKRSIYEKHGITIMDISNLLYICKDNQKFSDELTKLVYYPIVDLAPTKPIGWYPDEMRERHDVHSDDHISELQHFKEQLNRCKSGKSGASEYERICCDILKFLFDDEFTQISDQHKTKDDLFRMDLLCGIKGITAFWKMLIRHYNTRFVVFEFKNYSEKISQNLVYITEKYLFNSVLRNVAFIISRKGFSRNAKTAALGCLRENGKFIIDITDEDLLTMVHKKIDGEEPSDYLLWKIERYLMSVGK